MDKDDDIIDLLQSTMRSEYAPDLPDDLIEKLLSFEPECPPGTAERIKSLFVAKVFHDLHPKPVKHLEENCSLGSWLRAERVRARLLCKDIADAIHKDVSIIQQLEDGDLLPWNLIAEDMASLAHLLRIHFSVLPQLVLNSMPCSHLRRIDSAADSRHEQMLEPETGSAREVADTHGVDQGATQNRDEEISNWLEAVRYSLQQGGANDLLE